MPIKAAIYFPSDLEEAGDGESLAVRLAEMSLNVDVYAYGFNGEAYTMLSGAALKRLRRLHMRTVSATANERRQRCELVGKFLSLSPSTSN